MSRAKKKPRYTVSTLPPGERLVSPEEFATRLGIAPRTLQKWVAIGKVPPPMALGYKTKRWTESFVQHFLPEFSATLKGATDEPPASRTSA